jgi:hypothetical protein
MTTRQRQWLGWAGVVLVGVWLVAGIGYTVARGSKVTAEKVRAYVASVDLARLSGAARAEAIRTLAAQLNALSLDERRRLRMERVWEGWFVQMTEEEKGEFIEATLPTGFKQMLTAFEQLPEEKRRQAIDFAVKDLRRAEADFDPEAGPPPDGATNRPPVLSDELRQTVTKIGLRTYYSQSSAQTKAELAPLLEQLQRLMESGRFFRGR